MTKTRLKRLCRDHQLYLTPAMNDVLYLHYQGFNKVENLDEYTDLKCLWLHNNHLHDLTSGLAHLVKLKALYLHHNRIVVMRGLETLTSLVTLNLCHNFITKLELIGSLPHLQTLEVSHNKLSTTDSISILPSCRSLSCLDLSHNHLSDPTVVHVLQVLAGVVQLHVLQLQGNPCVGKVPHYRYSVTAKCQSLTYLDDRPVFPVDRAAAEAWS
ncbi:Leucine-rich repeat, partial [Trinorchestia longiramus]